MKTMLPPRINRYLSALYLRRKGVEWEGTLPHFNLWNAPQFMIYGRLKLGSGVKFLTDLGRIRIQVDKDALVTIGDRTVINFGVWIRATQEIVIESDVKIGPRVTILDSNLHPISEGEEVKSSPVRVGRNAIIGINSTVLKGVDIGEHSFIGGHVCIRKSIPPRTILGDPDEPVRTVSCSDEWIRP